MTNIKTEVFMVNLKELQAHIKTELLKAIELIENDNIPQEDKSLADGIKVVMVKDNLTNLVDYINKEINT